jgi:uroporphyrinogen decarboxylase
MKTLKNIWALNTKTSSGRRGHQLSFPTTRFLNISGSTPAPYLSAILAKVPAGQWIRIAQNALDIVGSMIDVIDWGDDVAIQRGPLFSPAMYRKKIKPIHQKMMAALKSNCGAYVVYHSCGSVAELIEDFIDIGVDALNPVQVSAKNMIPADLKQKYGERITFWGGIDTHQVLPSGTTEEVRAEVQCPVLQPTPTVICFFIFLFC